MRNHLRGAFLFSKHTTPYGFSHFLWSKEVIPDDRPPEIYIKYPVQTAAVPTGITAVFLLDFIPCVSTYCLNLQRTGKRFRPRCRDPPRFVLLPCTKTTKRRTLIMTTINLRDYYYWYTKDEFIDVPNDIAEELAADKRYEKTHQRKMRLYKVRSLDAEDGTENAAAIHSTDNPEAIFQKKEQFCSLCCALNSLPETKGRRIEAHYLLGMSQQEIVEAEGVTKVTVSNSIERGLENMRKNYTSRICGANFCPNSPRIYREIYSL
jgi:RNA polymerase sigma-70 factor (ECF subfamily)